MKKWFCELCDNMFDEPRWLISSVEEIPLCPECGSMFIDIPYNYNGSHTSKEDIVMSSQLGVRVMEDDDKP